MFESPRRELTLGEGCLAPTLRPHSSGIVTREAARHTQGLALSLFEIWIEWGLGWHDCCVLWGTKMPSWVCWRALGWGVEIYSLQLQRPWTEKRQVLKLLLATTGLFLTLMCKEGHPKAFCWKKCLLFLLVKQSQTNSEQVFTFWAFNAKTLCHAWEKCWPRGALPWSNLIPGRSGGRRLVGQNSAQKSSWKRTWFKAHLKIFHNINVPEQPVISTS